MKPKSLVTACAITLAISLGAGSLGLQAEEQKMAFDIKQQPLSKALFKFSEATNIIVLFDDDSIGNQQAQAIKGEYSPEEALKQMLNGSKIYYQFRDNDTLVISRQAQGDSAISEDQANVDNVRSGKEKVESRVINEIIVTATRREMNLQDVPMSINAFSGEQLETSGIEGIQDMARLVAGLHITSTNSITRVTVRGIGTTQQAPGADNSVAIHRDGVYIARAQDVGMSFFDIERIEVLRGPQGTLYGRNATGGSINIITKKPTEEFQAGGKVTIGNYDLIETEGYVSGPIANDKLLGRLSFKTRDNDGYTPNIYDSSRLDNDDFAGMRLNVSYEPNEDFRLGISADYSRDDGVPAILYKRGSTGAALPSELMGSFLPSGRKVNNDGGGMNEKESWGVSTKAEWDLGGATLTSLTAYRKLDWRYSLDFDGGNVSIGITDPDVHEKKQVSQELTLASPGDNGVKWIVGAFYFHGDEQQDLHLRLPTISAVTNLQVPELKTDAYAVFGEVNYPISDKLNLTLGARYSYEKKSEQQISATVSPTFQIFGSEELEDDWSSFTPKVALTYSLSSDVTAYATIGRGFKSGGYNANTLQGKAYDPEEVTNYEVGLKTSLYEGRLLANLAVFHMDYDDLQVQVRRTNPQTGVALALIENAATSVIRGIEFDFRAQPIESFSFDGNLSYLDATFDKWPDAIDDTRGGAAFDVSGNQMPDTPEWAANVGADFTFPVGDWGKATLRGEYSYKSRIYFTPFESNFESQEGVGTANARLSFEGADGKWQIAAWGYNLTDELIVTRSDENFSPLLGNRLGTNYAPPRTYGLTIGYNF